MQQYINLVRCVLDNGLKRHTSVQGIPNYVYPGYMLRFNMRDGFPLITVRNISPKGWRALVAELLWFLSGSSKVSDLHKVGVHLWDAWAEERFCRDYGLETGDLGRIYGPQWRNWLRRSGGSIDQITSLIDEIKNCPNSKRMMVTSWNPEDVSKVFIAPCHGIFKTVVAEGKISLLMFQRSADVPIGVPFNIASYSLLLLMIAQVTGLEAWEFVHFLADAHIYEDQIAPIRILLERKPRPLPKVKLNPAINNIFDFMLEDIELVGYDPHPSVKIPVSV